MMKGTLIYTPRFCTVRIAEVFDTREEAEKNGYKEPTYYRGDFEVFGKSVDLNRMVFAAVRRCQNG